ncbi:MAG: tetratricopeptide repeat protein, partial [Steroidobacteraceae bacterium]
ALALIRNHGNPKHEAVVLNSLGVTLTKLGRPDEARTVLEDSLAISRRIGERQLEAHALAGLGQIALSARDLSGAIARFEESRLVRHAAGDQSGEGWMHLRLSTLRDMIGDHSSALEARRSACLAADEAGDAALSEACRQAFDTAVQS